jgi:heme iron utilization protein
MTNAPREPIPMPVFDHVGMVRGLLAEARHGALGTLTGDGAPFSTLVALALDDDGVPIIITSHLSGHTGHMERDPSISLLVSAIGKGDPLAHPRVTLTGRAVAAHVGTAEYDRLRARYLTANPKAELYVNLPGFWFWRLEPLNVALNGGFGKAWTGPWSEIA